VTHTVRGSAVYAYRGGSRGAPGSATVVFVHGAANDHSVFVLPARYFAHHGRNVLAVDLPGHGRSAGAALASVEAIADWIVDVLDAEGVARASIVGHSFGALAALECAARHPSRVAAIALVGPAFPMAVSETLLAAARDAPADACAMIATWSHSVARQLGGNPVPGMWMTGTATRLMARAPEGVLETDLRACNDYAGGLAAAAAVRCPALLVVGARDQMAPPKAAQPLAAALAAATVVTLPGCGHSIMAEQPDALLDALRAFL